jgi:branched-chain amino acid transport system ATP-binding protein
MSWVPKRMGGAGINERRRAPSTEAGLLTLESVTSGYKGIPIVRDLSLTIERGASVAIVGRNGVGKTTLVKTIVGLLDAISGRVVLGGREVTKLDARERTRLGIGYVPQGRGIFARLSVFENLCMGELVGSRRNRYDYERIYSLFPILKERWMQRAGTLSGGEQQMLAIARILLGRPTILVLDEPSEGVQPSIVEQIAGVIAQEHDENGLTVLLVEQNLDLVYMLSDRCIVMDKGMVIAQHSPDELAEPEIARRYLAI